ncbi:methylenetetrahydrofolate reductase (NAD(P)H) met13 [Fusarium falciforme]|nr:methylenetetrahydrofolate reductase (NAD(P)H) met13 [Fusarium falciforme]
MKITEKLEQHRQTSGKPTYSFEYFVPKTTQGVQNLYDRMDRMAVDVLSHLSTDLVATAQSVLGLETCMHLTCTNMPISMIDDALENAYHSGCQNILALRGDPPRDAENWTPVEGGFQYAKDLIKYIKSKYGDHFAIGVAGYPECHPELPNKDVKLDLEYLKQKIDAGGDFIITQMFYDADNFINWCSQVRAAGMDVPIIPGIMPITTYAAFLRRAQWGQSPSLNISRPDWILSRTMTSWSVISELT